MSEQSTAYVPTNDFVVHHPCGCEVRFPALLKHKMTVVIPCKDHVHGFDLHPHQKVDRCQQRNDLIADAQKQLAEAMKLLPPEQDAVGRKFVQPTETPK